MRHLCELHLGRLGEAHFGVVGRQELLDTGISRHQVEHLVRTGRLVRLFTSVYRLAGCPTSSRQMLYAATLAARTWGAASHRSAAALHGLPGGTDEVTEVVAFRWRRKAATAIVAHETYLVAPIDFTVVDGIPVTSVTRTLCDLGISVRLGHISAATLEAAIEEAIRRGQTSPERIGTTLERLGGAWRPGAEHVERALKRFLPAMSRADSRAEVELVRILHDAGHTDVVTQHPARVSPNLTLRLDTYLPGLRVAPEFDSYRYHGGRLVHLRDANRSILLAGVKILRLPITDDELAAGCPTLLATLGALQADRAHAP